MYGKNISIDLFKMMLPMDLNLMYIKIEVLEEIYLGEMIAPQKLI